MFEKDCKEVTSSKPVRTKHSVELSDQYWEWKPVGGLQGIPSNHSDHLLQETEHWDAAVLVWDSSCGICRFCVLCQGSADIRKSLNKDAAQSCQPCQCCEWRLHRPLRRYRRFWLRKVSAKGCHSLPRDHEGMVHGHLVVCTGASVVGSGHRNGG